MLIHICEVCGVEKTMDSEEAFQEGWDYPPRMGTFGIVSPRTCGNCGIEKTLYWRLINYKGEDAYPATEEDRVLLERIQNEPESVLPKEEP